MLRGKRYNAEKQTHGGERIPSSQNDYLPQRTTDKIAQQFGVSPATIQRDGEYAKWGELAKENLRNHHQPLSNLINPNPRQPQC
jgi:hypothetical protein